MISERFGCGDTSDGAENFKVGRNKKDLEIMSIESLQDQ